MNAKIILAVFTLLMMMPVVSHAQNLPDKAKLLSDIEHVKGLSDKERQTLREAIQKIPDDKRSQKKALEKVSKAEKKRAIEIMKMNPELVREYQNELKEEKTDKKAAVPAQEATPQKTHKLHPNWDSLPESQKRALQAWEEKKARQKEMRAQYKKQVRQRSVTGQYDDFK